MYDFIIIKNGKEFVFYGAFQSGLFYSTDLGATWKKISMPFNNLFTSKVNCFQQGGNIKIVAASAGFFICSEDLGNTWSFLPIHIPIPYVTDILFSIDHDRSGIAFASTLEDGVYVTKDFGKSWSAWNIGLVDHQVYCLAMDDHKVLYGGTTTGLVESKNGGRAWREVTLPIDFVPIYSIAIIKDEIYLGTEGKGIFYSSDLGNTWQVIFKNLEDVSVIGLQTDPSGVLIYTSNDIFLSRNKIDLIELNINYPDDPYIVKCVSPNGLRSHDPVFIGLSNGAFLKTLIP